MLEPFIVVKSTSAHSTRFSTVANALLRISILLVWLKVIYKKQFERRVEHVRDKLLLAPPRASIKCNSLRVFTVVQMFKSWMIEKVRTRYIV